MGQLFDKVQVPGAVVLELQEGQRKGYDAPDLNHYRWLMVVEPKSIPSEWLTLDLGPGELAVLALALEHRGHIVLLDDALARQIAHTAGLAVWGTLRILLKAKSCGLVERIQPVVQQMRDSGMWVSDELAQRILALANEEEE